MQNRRLLQQTVEVELPSAEVSQSSAPRVTRVQMIVIKHVSDEGRVCLVAGERGRVGARNTCINEKASDQTFRRQVGARHISQHVHTPEPENPALSLPAAMLSTKMEPTPASWYIPIMASSLAAVMPLP